MKPSHLPLALRTRIQGAILLSLLPLLVQVPPLLAAFLCSGWLATLVLGLRKPVRMYVRLALTLTMLVCVAQAMGIRPGRDTGCALLAAMLAIKGSELNNRRDASSALGFSLFSPFAAFLLDQGPATLCLGLTAIVAVLACQARLTQWSTGALHSDDRLTLRHTAQLLLLSVPLTLVGFWLLPRLSTPLWGLPERVLSRPGLSDSLSPGQWLDLMVDDSPALRAYFAGPVPEAHQRYWRGPVLSSFDGQAWRRAHTAPMRLSTPLPDTASPRWHYRIDYEPTEKRALVALDLLDSTPQGSYFDPEGALYSHMPLNRLTRWELTSAPVTANNFALSDEQRQHYLQLPAGFNPRTQAMGQQLRQQALNGDSEIVQHALEWISQEFHYTLETPLPGRHLADEFLFDHKAGFCEHFSSAFAILMRSAGIPARVVTGFAGGLRNRYGDYWVVRRMDAHAWNEVWLGGRGWVRVDPTAAVAPERILDTLEDRLAIGASDNVGLLPTLSDRWQALRDASDWIRQRWNQQILGYDAAAQVRLLSHLRLTGDSATAPLIALWGLLTALLLGLTWWWLQRSAGTDDPLLDAWRRLGRQYRKQNLSPRPDESATAWALRVHSQSGDATALQQLAQRYNRHRYGGKPDSSLLRDIQRYRPPRK